MARLRVVNEEDCCWYCKHNDEYSFANDCECKIENREPFSREDSRVGVCDDFKSYLD